MKRLILIDASGYIYRAFFALPPLTAPSGIPVGAVYGFTNMLLKLINTYKNDHFLVVFDSKRKGFRSDIFPLYKANRSETPEDLIPQFDLLRKLCVVLGLKTIEKAGYEADDLIASASRCFTSEVSEVVILSSDKDLMQLVNNHVYMIDPIKQKKIDEAAVVEKFGVPPNLVIDVQSLMGDTSDNIPGAPGIGPKTATDLIQTYGSLDNLLLEVSNMKPSAKQRSILENKEQILLSKKLVTLEQGLSIDYNLNDLFLQKIDTTSVESFFTDLGFYSLISKIKQLWNSFEEDKKLENAYHLIQTEEDLKELIKNALSKDYVAIDTETTALDPRRARLVGISLSHEMGKGFYIPLSHQGLGIKQLDLNFVRSILNPLLVNDKIKKIGHNMKYDWIVLARHGFRLNNIEDTMVMSYVLDSAKNGHGMDELAEKHFNIQPISYKSVTTIDKKQVTFDYVSLEIAKNYASEDADLTLKFYEFFKERIAKEDLAKIYETLDLPMVSVLMDMENAGILIDKKYLQDLSKEFAQKLHQLEQEIYQESGTIFNVSSPKQLSEVLFKKLGLKPSKKSKTTGQFSTNSDVLEDLASQKIKIAEILLEWRQIAKLKSTYTDTLFEKQNPETGRIHSSFAQTITSTGRLSSNDPNLQNIPIKTEMGRKIRKAFIASPGHKIVSFDYSQIELRILAHMASVKSLVNAFANNKDVHAQTAAKIFKIDESQVTSDLRRKAKTINFGVIYGMGVFGLSKALGIEHGEAKRYIEDYFHEFPEIKTYMDQTILEAQKNGYVETLFGRKCFVPGINDQNGNMRAFAQRQAINAPIQGTSADMIKKAMIELHAFLSNHQTKMILQVHDELLFEVPDHELDHILTAIQNIMESVVVLNVPIPVNYKIGSSWNTDI